MGNGLILGFDLGITSVGWGIINHDKEVIDCGVRLFEEADKDNNAKRREKRGSRRVKRRRKQRIIELKRLLMREGIINDDFHVLGNPYHLRVKGLTMKLEHDELATALLHLVKRRGSSLDIVITDSSDTEGLKMKDTLKKNALMLNEKKKYVCEIQLERLLNGKKVRGEHNNFRTDDYVDELKQILSNQSLSQSIKDKIIELATRKRHYSEGPGSYTSPTEYGRFRKNEDGDVYEVNLIEEMRGHCSIYTDELRAPSSSFSALKFNLLNELNNLSFINSDFKWTKEKKDEIVRIVKEKGFLSPKSNPAKALSKLIGVEEKNITGFRINKSKKPLITDFSEYQKLLKVLKDGKSNIYNDEKVIDKISEILTSHKTESERVEKLVTILPESDLVKKIASLPGFTKYHRLSFKAIYLLNDELLYQNKNQMELINEMNLADTQAKAKLEIIDTGPMSPVVKRVQREAIKVLKELQTDYGHFDKIVIETTRAKNSKEVKDKIRRSQKYFEDLRKKAKELLGDLNVEKMSGKLVQKIMLYNEQNGKCAYTGNTLSLKAIATHSDDYEIDHIIPYSISLDNSQNNKVLVERKANQLKSNMSPFGYFSSGKAYGKISSFGQFKKIVNGNTNYNKRKRQLLLLMEDIDKYEVKDDFLQRNLVDTSYSIRQFMTALRNFYKSNNFDTKVFAIKGKHTFLFRNRAAYEYGKDLLRDMTNPLIKDRDYYRHHAIDALIVAMLSEQKLLKQLIKDERNQQLDEETGELYYKNPVLDKTFVKQLSYLGEIRDEQIKFSWKVDKKVNRSFSNETIYSTRYHQDNEYIVKKYDIYEMSQKEIERRLINEKERCLMYKHDKRTYDKVIKAYEQYKTEKLPFLAFKENQKQYITKYAKNNNGPNVKYISCLTKKLGNHIDISHNYKGNKRIILQNIPAYRIDVYQEPTGLYKFVTIRYYDLKPKGNSFEIDQSNYNSKLKQKKISSEATFKFSLHKNEVIRCVIITGKTLATYYYKFNGINDDGKNKVEVKTINSKGNKQIIVYVGSKMKQLNKFAVSPAGKFIKIENEILKMRV